MAGRPVGGADGVDYWRLDSEAPLYNYWDVFPLAVSGGVNDCLNVLGKPFPLPTGNLSEAVYTDEHGEAYVQFNPDTGNVLPSDGRSGYTKHRCDVDTGSLVGTASITASAEYPDQVPSWDAGTKDSNTLLKKVMFVPSKTLVCIRKDTNEAYCVETIKDLAGNPVQGAKVEFSASATADVVVGDDPTDEFKSQGFDTTGQGGQSPQRVTNGFVDLITNKYGQAGIYVDASNDQCVDVTVENVGTRNPTSGIKRDFDINPSSGAVCTSVTPTPTPTPTPAPTPTSSPVVLASPVARTHRPRLSRLWPPPSRQRPSMRRSSRRTSSRPARAATCRSG